MNWARRLKRVFGIEIEQCVELPSRYKRHTGAGRPELERGRGRCRTIAICWVRAAVYGGKRC
jgi:hypothetical protein